MYKRLPLTRRGHTAIDVPFSCSKICAVHFPGKLWDSSRINPLSANSDQKQFSPNNIHTLSRDKVMRINKMITKGKMPWSFIKFSQVILKKIYGDQFGEFVCGYWGLKGEE